ncbi:MAG: hypothetical protein IPQ08_10260 [Chitinophagaceae bacterium]|nr:hypothetical protein [Chitinophagaceae bacterium]
MDQQEDPGWDPRVSKLFRKIMNSVFLGLIWLLAVATAGLYFKLGYINSGNSWPAIIFYGIVAISMTALGIYLYRTWKDEF